MRYSVLASSQRRRGITTNIGDRIQIVELKETLELKETPVVKDLDSNKSTTICIFIKETKKIIKKFGDNIRDNPIIILNDCN